MRSNRLESCIELRAGEFLIWPRCDLGLTMCAARYRFWASPILTLLLATSVAIGPATAGASVSLIGLRAEYRENPLGIDVKQPRLSWRLESDTRGTVQAAYEIRVALSDEELKRGLDLIWDSGRVVSGESIQRAYTGPPLLSRRRYYWRVRVWDERGVVSEWSAPAWWEMGLLSQSDWTATWIEPALSSSLVPLLRRDFTLHGAVERARVYVTSHGLYQLFVNGQRVGNEELTPGFTSYGKRLQYQTYDVTDLLRKGRNAFGALLGQGWYSGVLMTGEHWSNEPNRYGDRTALLVQLEVTYVDGSSERVVSDQAWKASTGPILMSGIYAGETYDARLEHTGWSSPRFLDGAWSAVKIKADSKDTLVAQSGPPVRRVEHIVPTRIIHTAAGQTIVDMGQNMVGWVRLSVQGTAGTTVTLRCAEVLDAKGNLYTANLRSAAQTLRYTLKGGGVEVYEPHFTYQGFRYVSVDGYPGALKIQDIVGIVVHSDIGYTGEFETSNALLNKLQHNIEWGKKQTSSTFRPTAHSAMSVLGGLAMHRCLQRRQPSTQTSRDSLRNG